jgi:protein-S-isoprenylcysteine O-methyltransferase Ste14
MTFVLLTCLFALHLSFLWGRIAFFRIDGPTPPAVRLIEAAGTTSAVAGAALIVTRPGASMALDVAALLVVTLSALLFAWGARTVRRHQLTAAFSADIPTELVTTGAFRRIRNPFYTAYLLAHAMPVLASRSGWSALPVVWMTAIYMRAVFVEERKFLASPLADAYRRYQSRTGRFLPRWRFGRGTQP